MVFFSPHPDDVEFFAGGALLAHVAAGDAVTVVMMSHGEDGTALASRKGAWIAGVRTREAERRYAELPEVGLRWLDFVDGDLRYSPEGVSTLVPLVTELAPELVYLPASRQRDTLFAHPDHLAAGRMVEEALAIAKSPAPRRAYHHRRPNCFVDVDHYYAANRRALQHYQSQFGATASPPFLLTWGEVVRGFALRWWGIRAGTTYAEGFYESL